MKKGWVWEWESVEFGRDFCRRYVIEIWVRKTGQTQKNGV